LYSQFKYVGYNPKGYKYPSQVGVILKREYPGIIQIYDDNDGTVVNRHPAFSWNDYYWKRDEHGICYARRVKAEFWVSNKLSRLDAINDLSIFFQLFGLYYIYLNIAFLDFS
jgi:hypothetical protein